LLSVQPPKNPAIPTAILKSTCKSISNSVIT
jgi:hypothetical protein